MLVLALHIGFHREVEKVVIAPDLLYLGEMFLNMMEKCSVRAWFLALFLALLMILDWRALKIIISDGKFQVSNVESASLNVDRSSSKELVYRNSTADTPDGPPVPPDITSLKPHSDKPYNYLTAVTAKWLAGTY